MSKNAYAAKLQAERAQRDRETAQAAFDFRGHLETVALNNILGIGGKRRELVEAEVQRLLQEEFANGDKEAAAYDLTLRLEQIRGVKK